MGSPQCRQAQAKGCDGFPLHPCCALPLNVKPQELALIVSLDESVELDRPRRDVFHKCGMQQQLTNIDSVPLRPASARKRVAVHESEKIPWQSTLRNVVDQGEISAVAFVNSPISLKRPSVFIGPLSSKRNCRRPWRNSLDLPFGPVATRRRKTRGGGALRISCRKNSNPVAKRHSQSLASRNWRDTP